MDKRLEKKLRKIVHPDQPFGPIDASKISPDAAVSSMLFDNHYQFFRTFINGGHFLVGRRGSGKSALLNAYKTPSLFLNAHTQYAPKIPKADSIVISIESWKEFTKIASRIQTESSQTHPVEALAERWHQVFWLYLIQDMVRRGIFTDSDTEPTLSILSGSKQRIEAILRGMDESVDLNQEKSAPPNKFEALKAKARDFLQDKDIDAFILCDCMEEYHVHDPATAQTIGGLLRAVSEINKDESNIVVLFCLPAESYFHFLRASANPMKDFDSFEYLRWKSRELMQLAAYRLRLYLQIHEPAAHAATANIDIYDARGMQRFWSQFVPNEITNDLGFNEDPLPYIVRHTQLLPRQVLRILNKAAWYARRSDRSTFLLSEIDIKRAVRDSEVVICQEVFSAFKSMYPLAQQVCEGAFTMLRMTFKYGDLERAWRAHAKRLMAEMNLPEFPDFLRMVIAMGLVGELAKDRQTERYFYSKFEYRQLSKLVVPSDCTLCLHPIAFKAFNITKGSMIKSGDPLKTVWPIGTGLNEDYDS